MEPLSEGNIPLYNSRIIDTYIKLIKSRYTHINISELLSSAGMQSYEVADQGHWFTQEQIDRFYEKLVQFTGKENIAREAGRFGASPETIGAMRQYILGLIGPANAFEFIKQATSNFTRSSVYESRKIASNKVEIIVTPNAGVREQPFQCENRIGCYEAIVKIFNYELVAIEHTECMFKGAEVCRYVVTWKTTPSALLLKVRNSLSLILFFALIAAATKNTVFAVQTVFPISTGILLVLTLLAEKINKNELSTSMDNLRNSSEKLLEQININYKNALLSNAIGQAISKHTNIDDILASVIKILEEHLDYDRGLILLVNPEKTRLIFKTGFGYKKEHQGLLKKTAFHLDRPESKGTFVVSFREKRPILVNCADELEKSLSLQSLAFAKKLGSHSFICCPIIFEEESLGILAVDNVKSKKPLVQSDMSLLMGIAPVIGISIRNADLIQAKTKQFDSILQVLAASIDARDSLTAGHSEKVTEYALGISAELDLSEEYRDVIRVAALLHDYGKIGVPDSVLKKEGRLTEDEYEVVKSHAWKTREILEQINFEGILQRVPEIAGAHHEKLDGSGYPYGLHGKDIPLGAKIIAVADFFEAITAKRHYRDPMPINVAFHLLNQESGKHFERKIVNAMVSYYSKAYLTQNHNTEFIMNQ